MSRRCPKRNYLFLNWLKANRFRFLLRPHVIRFRKRRIDFGFHGITPALRFRLEFTASGGPWIEVDFVERGKEPEGLVRIYGAEHLTSQGWTSLAQRPEDCRYWPTREALWTDACFEAFMSWCNETLAQARCLAICQFKGATWATLLCDETDRYAEYRIAILPLTTEKHCESSFLPSNHPV